MPRVVLILLLAPFLLATLPAQAQFLGNQDVKTIPPQYTNPHYNYPSYPKYNGQPSSTNHQINGAYPQPPQSPRPQPDYKVGSYPDQNKGTHKKR